MKKVLLLALMSTAFAFQSCNQGSGNPFGNVVVEKTPEQLKAELRLKEEAVPGQYLVAHGTMTKQRTQTRSAGLFHSAEYADDGVLIEGTISNSASIAKFKDAILKVTFMSQTKTVLDEKSYVIYKYYNPNGAEPFSLHLYPPAATSEFSLEVTSATPVY